MTDRRDPPDTPITQMDRDEAQALRELVLKLQEEIFCMKHDLEIYKQRYGALRGES